jgi:hypothetical protein
VAVVDLVRRVTRRFGVDIVRHSPVPPDFGPSEAALVELVTPFTMTSPERIAALVLQR